MNYLRFLAKSKVVHYFCTHDGTQEKLVVDISKLEESLNAILKVLDDDNNDNTSISKTNHDNHFIIERYYIC